MSRSKNCTIEVERRKEILKREREFYCRESLKLPNLSHMRAEISKSYHTIDTKMWEMSDGQEGA